MRNALNQRCRVTGIALRVFNQPLAIGQDKLDIIVRNVVMPRLGGEVEAAIELDGEKSDRKPYAVTAEGVALIDVCGTLVRKASGLNAWSGLASYQQLSQELSSALADNDVRGILLRCDSPGGEVAGLYDFVDQVYEARGQKPIYAVASEMAYSAAYAVASAAERIFVTRTGGVGSIGIVYCHVDQSGADSKAGLKYDYIYFGTHKIDGNPHEPLSDGSRSAMEREGLRCYKLLVQSVARNRGLDIKAVQATEAALYFAGHAIEAGLADDVGTEDAALAALVERMGQPAESCGIVRPPARPDRLNGMQSAAESVAAHRFEAGASASTSTQGEAMSKLNTADAKQSSAKKRSEENEEQAKSKKPPKSDAEDADDSDEEEADDDEIDAESNEPEVKKSKHGKKARASAPQPNSVGAASPAPANAAAEIADLCILAGLPSMAASLIKAGASVEDAKQKLLAAKAGSDAGEIEQEIQADTGTNLRVPAAETGVVKKCKAMAAEMKSQRGRA